MPRKKLFIIDHRTNKLVKATEVDSYHKRVHYVVDDINGYQSPKTLKWVQGRKQRREDLKVSGCREVDPGEKQSFTTPPPDVPIDINWREVANQVYGQ